ncbi:MAG TPA: hypothetical protein VLC94_00145, partial [Candidatus Acidoferrum sp.]|nr:hypothetical protein [Candidatus Acidoferrum sp.]
VLATWAGTERPYEDFRRTDSLLARCILIINVVLTVGAVAALGLLLLPKNDYAFPLAVFPVLFPAIYYVTHTSLRYRHPIDPLLLLLTAFAVSRCFRRNAKAIAPAS